MISLPNNLAQFSDHAYWEKFFKNLSDKDFEWYGGYKDFSDILMQIMKPEDIILVVGCGNSNLSFSLYSDGFPNITNIDISDKVVKQLTEKSIKLNMKMSFLKMDVLKMTFPDNTFNAVVDKGTLDALAHGSSRETYERLSKMWSEMLRVSLSETSEDGELARYICVSLGQGHILDMINSFFILNSSKLPHSSSVDRLKVFVVEKEGEIFPIFIFVFYIIKKQCKAKNEKSEKLENELNKSIKSTIFQSVDISNDVTQYESYAQLVNWIKTHQYHYALKQKYLKENANGGREISFNLFINEEDKEPRFTFYLTKCPDEFVEDDGQHKFAAFLVPLGREAEWLYNTPKGRTTLAKSARFKRLIIVHQNRNHNYGDLESIQDELSPAIKRYKPDDLLSDEKIPILSLGDDMLEREVVEKGMTSCSGYEYQVEDVKLEEHEFWLRRLYFLNAPSLIQSEIRLLTDPKGDLRPDLLGPLQFEHHKAMVTAIVLIFPNFNASLKCLIIGLGGGALSTFLLNFFPSVETTVVEIDQKIVSVATRLFGYQTSSKCKTEIEDGLTFLAKAKPVYDIIIIDVNTNDPSEALFSPPASFITPEHLKLFQTSLNKNGVLMTTVLTRDAQAIENVEETFAKAFPEPYSRALIDLDDQELDKVIQIIHQDSKSSATTQEKDVLTHRYAAFESYLGTVLREKLKERGDKIETEDYMFDLEMYLAKKLF